MNAQIRDAVRIQYSPWPPFSISCGLSGRGTRGLRTVQSMTIRSSGTTRHTRKAPTASIRYEDASVREVPVRQLRSADFAESMPWRDVR